MKLVLDFTRKNETTQRKKLKELIADSDYIPIFPEDDFARTDGKIYDLIKDKDYVFESKWYGDINHPRYSNKFPNYQIDYKKLEELEMKSIEENGTPLLICFFSNELVVWDINKTNWKSTKRSVCTNMIGGNYGKYKEWSDQAYLKLEDAIYRNPNITPFN